MLGHCESVMKLPSISITPVTISADSSDQEQDLDATSFTRVSIDCHLIQVCTCTMRNCHDTRKCYLCFMKHSTQNLDLY